MTSQDVFATEPLWLEHFKISMKKNMRKTWTAYNYLESMALVV